MGNAGLFFVGIVLLVNGLVILNVVPARSAAILNLFVGALQVLLPTIILIQSGGDQAIINATWPTYLFGFTYLYYGLGIFLDLEPQGLGWFSAFVAAVALYEASISTRHRSGVRRDLAVLGHDVGAVLPAHGARQGGAQPVHRAGS